MLLRLLDVSLGRGGLAVPIVIQNENGDEAEVQDELEDETRLNKRETGADGVRGLVGWAEVGGGALGGEGDDGGEEAVGDEEEVPVTDANEGAGEGGGGRGR